MRREFKIEEGEGEMAMTGLLGLLMAQGAASAESKFLPLIDIGSDSDETTACIEGFVIGASQDFS